jgi:phospholipase/carboxylesterase
LPEKTVPHESLKPALRKLPFLVMHGIYDDVLPIAKGRAAHAWLQEHIEDLTYREYPIAHQIADSGIELICSWLEKRVPEASEKE